MCGWAGAGNIGDELLTRAIVGLLRAAGAAPVVASRDPAATRRLHGVDAVAWGPGAGRAVGAVDGVIVGPGGILQDDSSLWNLPGHLAPALRARARGLPVAAVGVGAEPLRRRSSRALLRRALAGRPVVTRDEASTAALIAAGIDATTGVDLVFGLDLDIPSGGDRPPGTGEVLVAVGPRVRPGLLLPAARRLEPPPIAAVVAAIERLAEREDAPVALAAFRGRRDRDVAEDLAARLTVPCRTVPATVDAHVAAVAGARVVLASRYHAVVLAARAGVPAVVVSSEPKLVSLAADLPGATRCSTWADVGSLAAVPAALAEPVPAAGRAAVAVRRLVDEAGAHATPGGGG